MLTKDLPDELLPEKASLSPPSPFNTIAFSERTKSTVAVGVMGVENHVESFR